MEVRFISSDNLYCQRSAFNTGCSINFSQLTIGYMLSFACCGWLEGRDHLNSLASTSEGGREGIITLTCFSHAIREFFVLFLCLSMYLDEKDLKSGIKNSGFL